MSALFRQLLTRCDLGTLQQLATRNNIDIANKSKKKLIQDLSSPDLNKEGKVLGVGKEGKAVELKYGVVKKFKLKKSPKTLENEAQLQIEASKRGISPKVYDYDLEHKCIKMEKMGRTLHDILEQQDGELYDYQQQRIIDIFKVLDDIKIFHADPNVFNFMEKDEQLYIIDFGLAKRITPKLEKQHAECEDGNLNMYYMPLGLFLRLKELCPLTNFDIIKQAIPKKFQYLTQTQ